MNKRYEVCKEDDSKVLYAYLSYNHPVSALNIYRGVLMPPHKVLEGPQAISLRLMHLLKDKNSIKIHNEAMLELSRRRIKPNLPSRLKCIYYFESRNDALEAGKIWGSGFDNELLSEIGFPPEFEYEKLDSNWITFYFPMNRNITEADFSWMESYWNGETCPNGEKPVWEILVDEPGVIWGIELREKVWNIIKTHLPASLSYAELSRIAGELNSNFGLVIPCVFQFGDKFVVNFIGNIEDHKSGKLADLVKNYTLGSRVPMDAINMPDLQKFSFEFEMDSVTASCFF